jgi:hypothetical protein
MTSNAELVSIGVPEVGAIVVLVILRPQARRSFRCASVGERDCDGCIYKRPAFREECDHLTVAWLARLLIERPANEKERPRTGMRLPPCPRAAVVTEASLDAQGSHQRVVESECTVEVADANEDV